MFTGSYDHSLDAKGRLIMPAKFRDEVGQKFRVLRGLDGCVYIYPEAEFASFVEALNTLTPKNRDGRKMVRKLMASAKEVDMDKQGRFILPAEMKEHAGLIEDKDVIFVGMFKKIELWSAKRYDSDEVFESDIDDIVENMEEQGINLPF